MSIAKRVGMMLLSGTLMITLVAGCGSADKKTDEENNATTQQEEQAGEEQQVPALADILPTLEKVAEDPDEVVAVFKDQEYTAAQFQTYLGVQAFIYPDLGMQINDPALKMMLLESMVNDAALAASIKEQPKDLVQEVETQYENIIATLTQIFSVTEDELMSTVKEKLGVDKEQVLEQMQQGFLAREALMGQVEALKTNIDKTYAENPELFTKASVRHILIAFDGRSEEEAKQEADQLVAQLKDGADFAALAKEKSEDPGSKENGGLYEDAPVFQWVPEFKEAALTLDLNEIAAVRTNYGYHVMRVEERDLVPKAEAQEYLAQQRLEGLAYQKFLDEEVEPYAEFKLK